MEMRSLQSTSARIASGCRSRIAAGAIPFKISSSITFVQTARAGSGVTSDALTLTKSSSLYVVYIKRILQTTVYGAQQETRGYADLRAGA